MGSEMSNAQNDAIYDRLSEMKPRTPRERLLAIMAEIERDFGPQGQEQFSKDFGLKPPKKQRGIHASNLHS